MRSVRISRHSCRSSSSFSRLRCTGYSTVSSSGVAGLVSPQAQGFTDSSSSSVDHLSRSVPPLVVPNAAQGAALLLWDSTGLAALRHCVLCALRRRPVEKVNVRGVREGGLEMVCAG